MIADTAGYSVKHDAVEVIGYANSETREYVMFQHVEGEPELHFEWDDQANGGYDIVRCVHLSPARVLIEAEGMPDGRLEITFAPGIEGRAQVDSRLHEILAVHGVTVERASA